MDGWAGPFVGLGVFVPVETGGLETYSLSPLLRLQKLDRPACVITLAIPTV